MQREDAWISLQVPLARHDTLRRKSGEACITLLLAASSFIVQLYIYLEE